MINDITISDSLPTFYPPLGLIVVLTAIKDFLEDYKRKKSDNEENAAFVKAWDPNEKKFVEKHWQDLYIGNIVKVDNNEFFPADLLLLSTSEDKALCYIETKGLDGETNLKQRTVSTPVHEYFGKSKEQLSNFNDNIFKFTYELPNPNLYKFSGTV